MLAVKIVSIFFFIQLFFLHFSVSPLAVLTKQKQKQKLLASNSTNSNSRRRRENETDSLQKWKQTKQEYYGPNFEENKLSLKTVDDMKSTTKNTKRVLIEWFPMYRTFFSFTFFPFRCRLFFLISFLLLLLIQSLKLLFDSIDLKCSDYSSSGSGRSDNKKEPCKLCGYTQYCGLLWHQYHVQCTVSDTRCVRTMWR